MRLLQGRVFGAVCAAAVVWWAAVPLCAQAASGTTSQSKGQSAAKERITRTRTLKEVQGELVSISKRGISILFGRDTVAGEENEIMIPYSATEVELQHIQSIASLSQGDIVRVVYEETTVQGGNDDGRLTMRAKLISFVRKGQKKAVSSSVLGSSAAESGN